MAHRFYHWVEFFPSQSLWGSWYWSYSVVKACSTTQALSELIHVVKFCNLRTKQRFFIGEFYFSSTITNTQPM